MSIETLSVLIVGALALALAKVRKLDGKRYEPASVAMDAQYFTMPDGTTVRRR